jgi:UDP-N-acetylmuramoyl-tripeptide--D-alanyl-D-alanine ligase
MRHIAIICLCVLSIAVACAQDAASAPFDIAALQRKLAPFGEKGHWERLEKYPEITRAALIQSIEAARAYYLSQQKQDGRFTYLLNLVTGNTSDDNNSVRQAGALWGLSCLNRDRFNEPTRRALLLGMDYYAKSTRILPTGEQCSSPFGEENITTGTIALYCLSIVEFLRGQADTLPADTKEKLNRQLDLHLAFLKSQELPDGSWCRSYNVPSGVRNNEASPYYDGETLLAYCKAARYCGRTDLLERINDSLPRLVERYLTDIWLNQGDTDDTKGFYQWGCMAYDEYVAAGWEPCGDVAALAAKALTWWQLEDNHLEIRGGNVGYAVEGLMATWRIAKLKGDTETMAVCEAVTKRIMARLMTLQVGGPFVDCNPNLKNLPKAASKSFGGIVASRDQLVVRIDVVQHQLHAMLMMLKELYTEP